MTLTTTKNPKIINKKKPLRLYQKNFGTNECFHQSDRKSKFKGQENSYTPLKKINPHHNCHKIT